MDSLLRHLLIVILSYPQAPQVVQFWSPPNGNLVKLNFDGCSIGNLGPSGMGGSLFASLGHHNIIFSGPLELGDLLTAELKALLFGLKLIHSKRLADHIIEVEGDLAVVIEWMRRGGGGPWRLSHAIKEAVFLASSLNNSFKWIPRKANAVANGLAKRGVQKEYFCG